MTTDFPLGMEHAIESIAWLTCKILTKPKSVYWEASPPQRICTASPLANMISLVEATELRMLRGDDVFVLTLAAWQMTVRVKLKGGDIDAIQLHLRKLVKSAHEA